MAMRVVVVGAGFGGLNAARGLARHKDCQITILDRRNHHLFQPLLYQVAMAGLNPADIAMPIRTLFRRNANVRVLLAEVTGFSLSHKIVRSTVGDFAYDYLLLACGAEHSYFGHDAWEECPWPQNSEQAIEIRRRVLTAFEEAEAAAGQAGTVESWLTFVVVGGGPTGAELSGALGEITRHTLAKDFRRFNPRQTRIVLIEAGPRLLASFPESLASQAQRDLAGFGVEILTNTRVQAVTKEGVQLAERFLSAER